MYQGYGLLVVHRGESERTPLPPLVSRSFFKFLPEFFSRALLSERLEQAIGHTSHFPLVRTYFSCWVKAPHYIPVSNLHSINVSGRLVVVRMSHIFKTMLFRSFAQACLNEFPCDESIKRWSMEIFLWVLVIKGVIFLKR